MSDLILGLFYSDENNIVHENVKLGKNLTEVSSFRSKLLPLKFFGPLFLSSASEKTREWRINLVEGLLSEKSSKSNKFDIIQSFFVLNSSILYEESPTHLTVLIGSPYTEDINWIYKKVKNYIHPSIIQNKILKESVYAENFEKEYDDFIKKELLRGINLIEFSLGSSRKPEWHKKKKYYCIAILERIKSEKEKTTCFYTFDKDSEIRKAILNDIPSYYLISILPGYYEGIMDETLTIFNKNTLEPNIAKITLKNREKEVFYIEEFERENGIKRNLGVVLIPCKQNKLKEDLHSMSFFKQELRQIFEKGKDLPKTIIKLNKDINPFKKWITNKEENLKKIQEELDSD